MSREPPKAALFLIIKVNPSFPTKRRINESDLPGPGSPGLLSLVIAPLLFFLIKTMVRQVTWHLLFLLLERDIFPGGPGNSEGVRTAAVAVGQSCTFMALFQFFLGRFYFSHAYKNVHI